MCTRRTTDPLVRAFLDRYGLNLLAIPREFVNCGDVYINRGSHASTPVRLADLVHPAPSLPAPTLGERLADLSVVVSNGVSLSSGMNVLGGLLTAIGAGALLTSIESSYQHKKSDRLRFRVRDATRDSIDPSALGAALKGCRIDESHPLASDSNSYFVVSAVVRTQAISITAEDALGNSIDVGAEALKTANAHADLEVNRASNGEITYKGRQKLAIGVELYELIDDREQGSIRMRMAAKRARSLRGKGAATAGGYERAFLGGADGDVFITTVEPPAS